MVAPVNLLLFICLILIWTAPAAAQNTCTGSLTYSPTGNGADQSSNCSGSRCYPPIVAAPTFTPAVGCDPQVETCAITAEVPLEFPGNHQNFNNNYSFATVDVIGPGGSIGSCGSPFARITQDFGTLSWSFQASCAALDMKFTVRARACPCVGDFCPLCERTTTSEVSFRQSDFCRKPPSCKRGDSCLTCKGPSGGSPSGGGGGSSGGPGTGPGAVLHYLAGGAFLPHMGSHWAHTYSDRLVPLDDKVMLLETRWADVTEYYDLDLNDEYERTIPSDDERELIKLISGWELHQLDGTVQSFDSTGRWTETLDRHGNRTFGVYAGGDLTEVHFPDQRHEVFTYHPSGLLATITEVGIDGTSSRVWSYTWAGGNLVRIDRPDGTALRFVYDDPMRSAYMTRRILVGTDGSERIDEGWEYDPFGNVVANWRGAEDPDDPEAVEVWRFAYDRPRLAEVTTITDPLGTVSTHSLEREPDGFKPRLTKLEGDCPSCGLDPNSQLFYSDPNHPLRPTREIDGRGNESAYAYSPSGEMAFRLEALGTPLERETTWQYDANYPMLVTEILRPSAEDPLSFRRTTLVRDAQGFVTDGIEEGLEGGVPFSYTAVMVPTAEGQVESTDPPGYGTADQTSYTYDPARGSLIVDTRTDPLIGTTIFGHDPFNRRTSVTDPNGVVTETFYDSLDRVTFVIQRGDDPGTTGDDLITENRYNAFGDLFQSILPRGNVIEYGYDHAGRLRSVERKADAQPTTHGERTAYTLDAAGNRTLEEEQRWDGAGWGSESATEYVYNNRCQLDKAIAGAGSATESVTEYAYDCEGNLEQIWDANHPSSGQTALASTEYKHDALDRLEKVVQPWGGADGGTVETVYGYDLQDHLTQVTDGEGTVTRYFYSDRDLLTREISEISGTTTYLYNEHGELRETTDARNITKTRLVDALDRVEHLDFVDNSLDIDYVYDDPAVPFSMGRLTAVERGGESVDYRYDRFGRVVQDGQLGYGHDANGNRESILYPGGVEAFYTFDFADRHESLEARVPGRAPRPLVSAASYRPGGPLESLAFGNGLTEARDFDARYFPERITVSGAVGGPVLDWEYTVDDVGNILEIDDPLAPAVPPRTYGYQGYQYYLEHTSGPWRTFDWAYDKVGNRIRQAQSGEPDVYTYRQNAAGGNTAVLESISGASPPQAHVHGPAGHLERIDLSQGRRVDFGYGQAGRLDRMSNPQSEAPAELLYDGRSFLARAGSPTLDQPLNRQLEATYSSEGLIHRLERGRAPNLTESLVFYFAGRPTAQLDNPGKANERLLHLTPDQLGTPIHASDATGATLWQGGFEPFGQDEFRAERAGIFLRLPGQWEDELWARATEGVEEFYYNVHRWYDSESGRYNRKDPVGDVEMRQDNLWYPRVGIERFSLYSYVDANPVSFIDPLGLLKFKGCNPDEQHQISKAFKEYCQKIEQQSFKDCMACEAPGLPGKLKGLCDADKRTVRCKSEDTGNCAPEGLIGCAWAVPLGRTIRLCPGAWTPTCGPLGCTLMHEMTHQLGFPGEAKPGIVEKCLGC